MNQPAIVTAPDYPEQKRHAYRARVLPEQNFPVTLVRFNGESLTGKLIDISTGGIAMQLEQPAPSTLQLDETFHYCMVKFGDDLEFQFRVGLVYQHTNPPCLGLCYIGLDRVQERFVERLVTQLDRQARRRAASP